MITRLLPCLLILALVPQCSARKIKAFAGTHANFAGYKTYQWLPVKALAKTGLVEDEPMITPIIKEAVNREMTALGLTEVRENADLQVAAFVSTTSVPQLEAVIFGNGMDFDYGTAIATMGRYNKEGTLAINLIDSRTNKSAWAVLASDSLDNKAGSGAKKIPDATAAMFRKYPTKTK
ncbi:MAG: DUF4136 domain-containing protein [Candidatus Solibacter sp.]